MKKSTAIFLCALLVWAAAAFLLAASAAGNQVSAEAEPPREAQSANGEAFGDGGIIELAAPRETAQARHAPLEL